MRTMYMIALIAVAVAGALMGPQIVKWAITEKPECAKEMNEIAAELRKDMERDIVGGYSSTGPRLENIQSCRGKFNAKGLNPGISVEEILNWVRASGKTDMRYAKDESQYLNGHGPSVRLAFVQKARERYGLEYSDFGTSEDEIRELRHRWAEMKLDSLVANLADLRPNGLIPDPGDFDKAFREADKFRTDNSLEWSVPKVYLECLRGKYYAARARGLYETLRFYEQPRENRTPNNFAEAIYEASAKKGFCGYPVPTTAEVERAKKLAYARMADQLLTDLRAKKYSFPSSLRKVDELKKILKDGSIELEELSTSEDELQDLSRENPLGKPVGC